MIKKYGLNKQESDRLSSLLSVAQLQEEIFGAITDRYKSYLVGVVFKRLSIESKLLEFSKVDIGKGELIIEEPKTENKKK
jgi:hypothetical protein